MSLNIDHTTDTITTTSGTTTIDGPTVPANSSGNVARWVMTTGNTGASSVGYWTKIFTTSSSTAGASLKKTLLIEPFNDTGRRGTLVEFGIRNDGTPIIDASKSYINALYVGSSNYFNGFKMVSASTAGGTDVEIWMQTADDYSVYSITEIGEYVNGSWSEAYNNASTWTATTPTGAGIDITSDWAGSGQLTSPLVSNGWAGTAYYEKSADGWVKVYLDITTIGTTTAGTIIFTIPALYRPGFIQMEELTGDDSTYASAAGRIRVETGGVIRVYGYTGTNTAAYASFMYRARN